MFLCFEQACQLDIIYYLIHKLIFLCIFLDYKSLKFKFLIDDIVIDFLFSEYFASIEHIRRKYNPIVNLSKFTSNKKILSIKPNFILKITQCIYCG